MYPITAKTALEHRESVLKEKIKKLWVTPKLAIVTDFSDAASKVYIRNKVRKAEDLGMHTTVFDLRSPLDTFELDKRLKAYHGVIFQQPMRPEAIADMTTLLEALEPYQDVDGFRPDSPYLPCTAQGVLNLLKGNAVVIERKVVLIIGRGKLAAEPLRKVLSSKEYNCTVIQAHSHTRKCDIWKLMEIADIIISAVGIPEIWQDIPDPHQKILVDIGISFNSAGKLVGDFSNEVREKAFCATPVPGGVGPMTVMSLMENVVFAASYANAQAIKNLPK